MNWKEILAPVLQSPKMQTIKAYLNEERKVKNIYPEGKNVFRAFDLCPFDNTKIVILGEEPYADNGSDGLAYSSQGGIPPDLLNIFKEIYRDMNIQYSYNMPFEDFFPNGNLEKWARNGFLLLNTTLTVEEGHPSSHKELGWEMVAKCVIEALNKKEEQIIFLLWGENAWQYESLISNVRHVTFKCEHPKKEEGFFGCRHFSIIRDVIPAMHGRNIFPTIRLDSCFDKEAAKKIVRENYPIEAEKICKYIDDELIINVPINREIYWREVRNFEKMLSTKIEKEL